jgi:YVTN family beta-propeller protein
MKLLAGILRLASAAARRTNGGDMDRKRRATLKDPLILVALIVVVALAAMVAACGSSSSTSSTPSASPAATIATAYNAAAVLLGKNVPSLDDWNTDQLLFDSTDNRVYLADASNWAVDVWDIGSSTFIAQITGFAGPSGAAFFNFDKTGPNGLALDDQGRLWVGDGDGSVKIIDTKTLTVTATIATGAKNKVDAIAIDSADGVVMVTCPAEGTETNRQPMVAFIDPKTLKLTGTTPLTGVVDVGQAVYSKDTGKFYVPVTSNGTTDVTKPAKAGGLAVIDPKTRQITNTMPLGKMVPTGAAFGPGTQLCVGTATEGFQGEVATATFHPVIIDVANGKILATLPTPSLKGRGIDGVSYDSGSNRYFLADMSPTNEETGNIWVYDAATFQPLSAIAVGAAHPLAVDTSNHHLFVPVNLKGLTIYVPGGY